VILGRIEEELARLSRRTWGDLLLPVILGNWVAGMTKVKPQTYKTPGPRLCLHVLSRDDMRLAELAYRCSCCRTHFYSKIFLTREVQ
jgi:hypothetical protein